MIYLPRRFKFVELPSIGLRSDKSATVTLETTDTFVFGHHFLKVAPALCWSSAFQKLRKQLKDSTKSILRLLYLRLRFEEKTVS